jgi:hypothetical protein
VESHRPLANPMVMPHLREKIILAEGTLRTDAARRRF